MISLIRLLERNIVNREDIFMMKIGILILCFAVLSIAGSFKDKRDGQIYKTVKNWQPSMDGAESELCG